MYVGGQQTPAPLNTMRSASHSGSADEYQQNYLFRHQQMNQGPYQHGSHSTYDEQLQNLNSMVVNLVSKVARLSESNEQILLVNARHSIENDALTLQIKTVGLSQTMATNDTRTSRPETNNSLQMLVISSWMYAPWGQDSVGIDSEFP